MSPIEAHWISRIERGMANNGIPAVRVVVMSADADNWRFRIGACDREFEIGFNHRDRYWCRETTDGAERHFVSNDLPGPTTSAAAFAIALRTLGIAIRHPEFAPRDPPVI